MMILCDTEIRTYVLLNKGQPAAARKKWDFLDFPVGLPNLRGRKSGTSCLKVNGSPGFDHRKVYKLFL